MQLPRPGRVAIAACALLLATAPARTASTARSGGTGPGKVPDLPGIRRDGSILLPNQWSLRPAGKHLPVGDFPVHLAVHPGGRYAILLHAGYGQHELVVVHLADFRIVSRTALAETFYGVAFSADGRRVFASGAGSEVVHRFDFSEGLLANPLAIEVRPVQERGIVSGVAVSPDGRRLFTTELYGGLVSEFDASTGARRWSAPVGVLGQASLAETRVPGDFDQAAAEKRAIAQKDPQSPAAPYPYACAFDAVQDRLYVTLWAQATVVVLDTANGRELARWRTEEHPNELLLNRAGTVLYVAN
ncbi:MAG: YncE family protein, partial [Verrucomicrobiota bacterium]